MKSHRETCIIRLAELADDDELRAAIVWGLCKPAETAELSLLVQSVLELKDSLVDAQDRQEKLDELERRSTRG